MGRCRGFCSSFIETDINFWGQRCAHTFSCHLSSQQTVGQSKSWGNSVKTQVSLPDWPVEITLGLVSKDFCSGIENDKVWSCLCSAGRCLKVTKVSGSLEVLEIFWVSHNTKLLEPHSIHLISLSNIMQHGTQGSYNVPLRKVGTVITSCYMVSSS